MDRRQKKDDDAVILDKGAVPGFRITDLNEFGEMQVSFSQNMKQIEDLTLIDAKALKIELIPDESNIIEDLDDIKFTWDVKEFHPRSMKI